MYRELISFVDRKSRTFILEELSKMFLRLVIMYKAVICCRSSLAVWLLTLNSLLSRLRIPLQNTLVVTLMKMNQKPSYSR
jgi:hypothetical protein